MKIKLYLLLLLGCLGGYIWIGLSMRENSGTGRGHPELCVVKSVTGVACPSCGTTRAVMSIVRGDFMSAGWINPLGYLVFMILVIVPPWILLDVFFKKWSLFEAYKKMEDILKIRWVALVLGILILGNWIWNITKGL